MIAWKSGAISLILVSSLSMANSVIENTPTITNTDQVLQGSLVKKNTVKQLKRQTLSRSIKTVKPVPFQSERAILQLSSEKK